LCLVIIILLYFFSEICVGSLKVVFCGKVKGKVVAVLFSEHHAIGGVDVYLYGFLLSALDGGEWSTSGPSRFTSREIDPVTHRIGGWVGPTAGLDAVVKRIIPGLAGNRIPDHPARSPALYH
jgi:hypothetical protein